MRSTLWPAPCYLEVPDAASRIHVEADLMRRCLAVSMTLAAPKDVKRAKSRVNWLVRQLQKSNSETVLIEAVWPGRAPRTRAMLAELRNDPERRVADHHKLVPTSFTVMMVRDIAGRFSGSRTFIEALEKTIPEFYKNVGQHLEPYRPKPPQIKAKSKETDSDKESAERESSEVAEAARESADEALGAALMRGPVETNR